MTSGRPEARALNVRLPDYIRERIDAYRIPRRLSVNGIIIMALLNFLDAHEPSGIRNER